MIFDPVANFCLPRTRQMELCPCLILPSPTYPEIINTFGMCQDVFFAQRLSMIIVKTGI